MKIWLITLVSALFFSGAVLAKNYGMAGCGLGSLVITGKSTGSQIFAATTNGTAYSQFFGITSGTSNCTDDGIALEKRELEYFTEANYESLIQEMAQGSGDNLNTFAMLFGCQSEEIPAFNASLQSNFDRVVPSAGVQTSQILENISQVNTLNNHCQEG